jgi:phosphoglycerate dehydrogenase-like enzyme
MKKDINLLATFKLDEEAQTRIRKVSDRINLSVMPVKSAEEISEEVWENVDVLFTQRVMPEPAWVPKLKWIQSRYAGIEDLLDHPLLNQPGICFTNMSGAITSQISEYIVMMILALGHQLPRLIQQQKEKMWPSYGDKWRQFVPQELRDSTVGIVGYGGIGRQVARLLQPFRPTILAAKKDVLHPEDTGYIPEGMGDPHGDFFDRLYPIEALHSLLEESDFVVLTLPLTDETYQMMNADAFEAMKPSAYLINIGRGDLIAEDDLIKALQTGQIAGAALDVFHEEPLPQESPLWEMPNVIITPHMSYLSRNFNTDTLSLFVENLNRFLADLSLYNQVDVKKGY